jgi:UDP-3-O-[3-hydroxymyristoyl] N-acetylglucosamine deacetylase
LGSRTARLRTQRMTTLTIESGNPVELEQSPSPVGRQRSLAERVRLSGTGLHSGAESTVTIHPAAENSGIVFREGRRSVRGDVSNVVDTSRGTTIGFNGTRIRTVEHLMAALRGTGIDNAEIEVTGSELPALDGSALPYCDAFLAAGLVEQTAERKAIAIDEPICVQQNGSFILAIPAPELRLTYVMNYDHPLIGAQSATYVLREWDFAQEIAPARTFVLYEEVAALLDNDLARGGSFDNAIVLWQDRMSCKLRFSDELVRHKVMDLIGDVSLVGGLLQAEVVAVKSGHALNVSFAREVRRVALSKLHAAA